MLENLIRVSPPQGGLSEPKTTRLDHDPKIREDFEKEFRSASLRKDDKEQVPKTLSGGNKKKTMKAEKDSVEEPDDKVILDPSMVSKNMASKENVVEIADSEKNLLPVENLNSKINIEKTSSQDLALAPEPQGQVLSQTLFNEQVGAYKPMDGGSVHSEFKHLNATEQAVLHDLQRSDSTAAASLSESLNVDAAATDLSEQSLQKDSVSLSLALPSTLPAGAMDEFVDTEAFAESVPPSELAVESSFEGVTAEPQVDERSALQKKIEMALKQDKASLDIGAQMNVTGKLTSDQSFSSDQSGSQSNSKNSNEGAKTLVVEGAKPDLSAQVSALHLEQKSFHQQMHPLHSTAVTAQQKESSAETMDENVKSIMNQAKFLVTQGGGEMTVKMTPEGMGEVQLKVMLDQGNINIELNSQDKSVKKLIEDNLSDLRSSLAAHQMRVDHVKINNVTAVDTNNQAQFQSNLNHSNSEQSNQSQNSNWMSNHFSQNSNGHRQSNEQSASTVNTVTPRESQSVLNTTTQKSSKYANVTNKGRSLNMVA